jgi:hypothetical protein
MQCTIVDKVHYQHIFYLQQIKVITNVEKNCKNKQKSSHLNSTPTLVIFYN